MTTFDQGSGAMAATLGSEPQPRWGREMHLICNLSSYESSIVESNGPADWGR
jgi:hypothetical protein